MEICGKTSKKMDDDKKTGIIIAVLGVLVGGSALYMFIYELIKHTDEVLKGIGICALAIGVMYIVGLFIEWRQKK